MLRGTWASHVMKSLGQRCILFVIAVAAIYQTAKADVLFGNPITGNNGGNDFNTGSFTLPGNNRANNIAAEEFILSRNSVIQSLTFVGYQDQGVSQPDSVNWFIYHDAGGLPGQVIASQIAAPYTVSFLFSAAPYDVDAYTLGVPSHDLAPGDYWFGFHVNTYQEPTAPTPAWAHADSGNGIVAHSIDNGSTWYQETGNYAFSVNGIVAPVPEPSSFIMWSLMFATFTLIACKHRRLKQLATRHVAG